MAKRDEEREKRLAAALRENLKRRKAQAREAASADAGNNAALSRRKSGPMNTDDAN
jgi:hypothetical protein